MNDNANDNLTDVLSNTIYKMRETFVTPVTNPTIQLPWQPTTPIHADSFTGLSGDCIHVGYDFPTDTEPTMMDLYVYESMDSAWVLLIRQGPLMKHYFTNIVFKDEPPADPRWERVYDAWQYHKECSK